MTSFPSSRITGIAVAAAIVAAGLTAVPSAVAIADDRIPVSASTDHLASTVTEATVRQAVSEARAAGAIEEVRVDADGARSVVIRGDNGASLEVSDPSGSRLSTGSDSYGGMFVGFNAFDQNLIIAGAMTAIAAGMCALGPAVCVIANVAALLASTAIGNAGGVQCGTKSLRVYPISQKKPRCA